jgi:hypothetical protein
MKKMMAEIFEELTAAKTKKAKVKILQQNDDPNLREFIAFGLNPHIRFLLPDGNPPFEPNDGINAEEAMYSEVRKLYLFVDGGKPELNQIKRETIYIDMLEIVHPKDAALLQLLKEKKLPGLTEASVREAYPGFLTY